MATILAELWFIKRTGHRDISRVIAIDMTLAILAGGLVGARIFHILWEDPAYYRQYPLRVFELWNGGFVFWGGAMGAALAALLYCKLRRVAFFLMTDLAIIPISFGYALGRTACFFNGCCYGRHCDLPWAVFMDGDRRHPTQLYASFWELGVLFILIASEKRAAKMPGRLFGLWLMLHSMGRIMMEYFRADPRGDFIAGQSIGTWISLIAIVAGFILFDPLMATKRKAPAL